jgi:hypothetical protein
MSRNLSSVESWLVNERMIQCITIINITNFVYSHPELYDEYIS